MGSAPNKKLRTTLLDRWLKRNKACTATRKRYRGKSVDAAERMYVSTGDLLWFSGRLGLACPCLLCVKDGYTLTLRRQGLFNALRKAVRSAKWSAVTTTEKERAHA